MERSRCTSSISRSHELLSHFKQNLKTLHLEMLTSTLLYLFMILHSCRWHLLAWMMVTVFSTLRRRHGFEPSRRTTLVSVACHSAILWKFSMDAYRSFSTMIVTMLEQSHLWPPSSSNDGHGVGGSLWDWNVNTLPENVAGISIDSRVSLSVEVPSVMVWPSIVSLALLLLLVPVIATTVQQVSKQNQPNEACIATSCRCAAVALDDGGCLRQWCLT